MEEEKLGMVSDTDGDFKKPKASDFERVITKELSPEQANSSRVRQTVIDFLRKNKNFKNTPQGIMEEEYEKSFVPKVDESGRMEPFSEPISAESRSFLNSSVGKKEQTAENKEPVVNSLKKKIDVKPDKKFVSVGEKTLPIPQDFSIDGHFSKDMATGKRYFDYENKPWQRDEVENLISFIKESGGNLEDYKPLFEKWKIPSLEDFDREETLSDIFGV